MREIPTPISCILRKSFVSVLYRCHLFISVGLKSCKYLTQGRSQSGAKEAKVAF